LILENGPHPERRACLGIVRLVGPYGAERVEAAADRATPSTSATRTILFA